MKNNYFFIVFYFIGFFTLVAQNTGSLKGNIKNEQGEPIIGANVIIKNSSFGTVSDEDGNYLIKNLKKDTYQIEISYLGFDTITKNVVIGDGVTTQDFTLSESSFLLEGVMVTAQKREQRNKDVPIAITSYGSDFINNNNTFEYDSFSEYVPGFQVQMQSVNNPGIVVRGITSDDGDSRVEPRVSIFQDGVSISKSRGSVVELFDIERVEVLKGPQGTLFGRGAQIGAMHIIQNKAKDETSGFLKLGYGNENQFLATGYFNTPITDKLFFRAAGIYNARDGFIKNISGGDLNGKETLAFRGSFKYLISEKTTLDLIVNWQKDTPPGTSFKSGLYAPTGGDTDPTTFADLERGEELGLDREVYGVTGILKHSFNDTWDLTSTTAYREFDSDEAFDSDGTVAPALFFHEIAEGKQFSQEFRFNFDNQDKFRGFFGANFFYEDGSQKVPFITNEQSYAVLLSDFLLGTNNFVIGGTPILIPAIPNEPAIYGAIAGAPLNEYNRESYTNFGENYSGDIFADASYDVTDKLTLTLGVRGTWENINAGYEVEDAETPSYLGYLLGTFPNNVYAPTNGRLDASDNFLSLIGRFAVNYDINEKITLFGNIARGRRPNVINVDANGVDVLSDETVWSYEIGGKSLFLNNRLQFDLNAYMYDYSHFQTNIITFDETNGLDMRPDDSGNATAYGFETAIQYAFSKTSSFFANYGYIDASFDDKDSKGNPQALAGNTFRLTPKHSFSLGVNFNPKINDNLDAFVRPTYTYKSKVFFEETNLPDISQDEYGLLNFRTGLVWNKKYEINFYMTNVLDEEYIIDAGNTGGSFGIPTYISGAPRFYGVQVSAKL